MGNLGSTVYNDSAGAGQIFSAFGLFIAGIIGIIMIVGAIYLLFKPSKYTASISGKITNNPVCNTVNNNGNITYSCNIQYSFQVNGSSYTGQGIIQSNIIYTMNSPITVYYEPSNPSQNSLMSDNYKMFGIILLIIAFIIIGIAFFWYWASRKNKFIASTVGASGALNLLSGGRFGGIV